MKMFKIAAVTVALLAGSSAAFAANPYDVTSGVGSLSAIQEASNANVEMIGENAANTLASSNDPAAVRSLLQNNRQLLRNIENQGFTVDQIVGVSGDQNGLTLYAL